MIGTSRKEMYQFWMRCDVSPMFPPWLRATYQALGNLLVMVEERRGSQELSHLCRSLNTRYRKQLPAIESLEVNLEGCPLCLSMVYPSTAGS